MTMTSAASVAPPAHHHMLRMRPAHIHIYA